MDTAGSVESDRVRDLLSEIEGIRQQAIIAVTGRLGVREGGTLECIRATLAETEAWPIDRERFGRLYPAAEQAKNDSVNEIRKLLGVKERGESFNSVAAAPTSKSDSLALGPVRELIALDEEIDRLEEEVETRKKRRELLERVVLESMTANGLRSIPLADAAGMPTSVYILSSVKVNARAGVPTEARLELLAAAGLGWLVRPGYDSAKLGAWVREQLSGKKPLPEQIALGFDLFAHDKVVTAGTTRKKSTTAKAAEALRAQQGAG